MLNSIGPVGLVVLVIAAFVIYGPNKLPELGKSLGKTVKAFKGGIIDENFETKKEGIPEDKKGEIEMNLQQNNDKQDEKSI